MKFLNYAKHLNAPQTIIDWVVKRMTDSIGTNEGEHVIDYLIAENPKITTANYEQVKHNAERWLKTQMKKGEHIKEKPEDTKVVLDFKDGFKVVQLIGKNAYDREGYLMRHCVASYFGKSVEIYSLRDEKNMPHCTMEKDNQIKGKGNGDISPKYIGYVVAFLKHVGMQVRDSEMLHLGYFSAEKLLPDLGKETKAQLFDKKYLPKNAKLIDKKGNEFATLDILDQLPLLTEEVDGNLKINFELPPFIKLCVDFIFKKSKSVLSKSKWVKAASGNYSKLAASGYNSKLAASGESSNLAASGYYSKLAASGESSNLAASGNYSKLAASGNYSNLELSGEHCIGAAIGYGSYIKGKKGCWIVLAEYDYNGKPLCVKSAMIDGEELKEDAWYKLEKGKFVEVSD